MRTHRLGVLASPSSSSVLDDDTEASLATRQGGPAPSSTGEPTEPARPRTARLRDAVARAGLSAVDTVCAGCHREHDDQTS